MKKINISLYLSFILLLGLTFTSCEEDREDDSFDPQNGQTFVSFGGGNTADLAVIIDATGSIDIPVNVTTITSSERTFPFQIVEESTNADPNNYTIGSITIPANSHVGSLTINATDNSVETTAENLVLQLVDGEGYVASATPLTVRIFQVCPIPDGAFTGDYMITTLSPGVFNAGTYGASGSVVNISQGAGEFDREFTANYFEDDRFPRTFLFSLVCNEIIVPYQDQAVGCSGNDVNLSTGPPAVNGTYDSADDSSFIINVTDNVDSDCGGGPVQASYRFTKQ